MKKNKRGDGRMRTLLARLPLGYWQKVYLAVLCLFLSFFNLTVFAVAAYTNTDAFHASRDKLLTQQHYIVQSLADDMNTIYKTRPLGLPKLFEKKGADYQSNGILLQVSQKDELLYSSFAADYRTALAPQTGRRSWRVESLGEEKMLVATTALTAPFEGTRITAAFSMQEFFTKWDRTIRTIEATALFFSLLLAAALYLLLRVLAAPLRKLEAATGRLQQGDYAARVHYASRDEIGQLADRFNAMAQKIEQQIGELQQETQEKQRLVDALSHELRTPLAAISGYTQYMQMARLGEQEYFDTLGIIAFETSRMQRLADSILNISTLEQSGLPDAQQISIRAVLERIDLLWRQRAAQEQIAFHITPCDEFTVMGDFPLLESLVSNLIDNAFKACLQKRESAPPGFVAQVTLSALQAEEQGCILVSDNGCGMSDAALAEIGKPFYREDKARSRRFGGAGLGISICEKIAAAHGAELRFSSAKGAGTTATIAFTSC